MKLADMLDLGSNAKACRFKSCHPHHKNTGCNLNKNVRIATGVFCKILHIQIDFISYVGIIKAELLTV